MKLLAIFNQNANYTKDGKATIAKPSGDGVNYRIEVESRNSAGEEIFTEIKPGVVSNPTAQTTLENVLNAVDGLEAKLDTLQTAINAIKDTSGIKKINDKVSVAVSGSFATIKSAPVNGVKTVSTTAAEIFAGASRKANRFAMIVINESNNIVYWGATGVTTSNGIPLMPGDSMAFTFDTTIATPIYMVSSASSSVRVGELA